MQAVPGNKPFTSRVRSNSVHRIAVPSRRHQYNFLAVHHDLALAPKMVVLKGQRKYGHSRTRLWH
eukprot:1121718-Amphidinium_carterae.1